MEVRGRGFLSSEIEQIGPGQRHHEQGSRAEPLFHSAPEWEFNRLWKKSWLKRRPVVNRRNAKAGTKSKTSNIRDDRYLYLFLALAASRSIPVMIN